MNTETLVNELTGKNEQKALNAARIIVDEANTDAFSMLVDKSDYLFDFIKSNVNSRFESVISENNYKNLLKFLNYYSPDYEDLIAGFLAKYANEDLSDTLLEMLESGSLNQKIYCAKYFSYILCLAVIGFFVHECFYDSTFPQHSASSCYSRLSIRRAIRPVSSLREYADMSASSCSGASNLNFSQHLSMKSFIPP